MRILSIVWVVGFFALTFGGCKEHSDWQAKLDPRLKSLLDSRAVSATAPKTVPIFGTVRGTLTDSLRQAIQSTGARIGTTGGQIFTADVPRGKIEELAKMKEIKYLKLSEKAKPVK